MTSTAPTIAPAEHDVGSAVSVLWRKPFPFAPGEDPDAAPGARPLVDGVRRFTPRRALQNGVWTYAMGLAFLTFFFIPLLADPPVWWQLLIAVVLALAVAVAYIGTGVAVDLPLIGRILYVLGFLALLCGGLAPFIGTYVLSMTPYAAIMVAYLLPWRISRLGLPLGVLIGVVVGSLGANWVAVVLVVIGGGMGVLMSTGLETRRIQRRLSRAEQRIATLAVAAERERIARDLHDILGHSLTAVAVKAGLAGRLADVDPAAAKVQMTEVEQIARQALADVRATASGFRQVRLATEIASARSVLQAAGIQSVAPPALDPMPDEVSELFGYVVREGVTNVIRHAGATACTITASATRVTVSDDGVGLARAGSGSGLAGLRTRAETLGAVITTAPLEHGGTVLSAELDPRLVRSGS